MEFKVDHSEYVFLACGLLFAENNSGQTDSERAFYLHLSSLKEFRLDAYARKELQK